ncbi:MAG: hypothetical protein Q9226_001933 [Calogaya cf. arnoldii]
MSTQAVPRRILPKRARKETSYYPSESESENEAKVDEAYNSEEEVTRPSKKIKLNITVENPKRLPRQKIFPFMLLPAEVKNIIYAYALISSYEVPLVSKTKGYRHTIALGNTDTFQAFNRREYRDEEGDWVRRSGKKLPVKKPSFAPTIIALNREIHTQAQPILYGANAFTFEDPKALLAFCANIGPHNCAHLEEVSLKDWGDTVVRRAICHPAFAMLANAVNLKSLSLECAIRWGDGLGTARQFFRDGHNWLEAVGMKEGRKDAAVDRARLGMEHSARPLFSENVGEVHNASKEEQVEKLDKMTEVFRAELIRLLKA